MSQTFLVEKPLPTNHRHLTQILNLVVRMHGLGFHWRGDRGRLWGIWSQIFWAKSQLCHLLPVRLQESRVSLYVSLYVSLFIYKTGIKMAPGCMELRVKIHMIVCGIYNALFQCSLCFSLLIVFMGAVLCPVWCYIFPLLVCFCSFLECWLNMDFALSSLPSHFLLFRPRPGTQLPPSFS